MLPKPMSKLPISVCMISGAEAHRIGRSLKSVADWTSELIVVLNADATDGTDEVARSYGAQVYREPWKGYLAQKNSAADKARSEWVFNLDADEVVSDELRAELLRLFQAPANLAGAAALNFPRRSWFCGRWIRHGDWYPDRQTRIWRRGQGKWVGIDPHPYVKVDGEVRNITGDLEHYSTDSINRRLEKIIPFSDEFVAQRGLAGRTASVLDFVTRPLWRFLRAYVIRLGFLDGWQGFYIASHTAFSTLVRYAKLREFQTLGAHGQSRAEPKAAQPVSAKSTEVAR
jgi:glycosyltransferase involved in cell wall biosynthesis